MPQNSYPFASVRVKARESRLLTREKAMRLLSTKDAAEALRMLSDFGYEGLDEAEPEDFEAVVAKELREACDFVAEITPNKEITDLFFAMYDYQNAKVWTKSSMENTTPPSDAIVDMGTMPAEKLFDILTEKRYAFLSLQMRTALLDLEKRFAVKPDISLIGLELDAAYAEEIAEALKTIDDKAAREYFEALFDFTNVTILIRMKRAGVAKDVYERSLLPGGTIDASVLKKAYDLDINDLGDAFQRTSYEAELSTAFAYLAETGKLTMFNKVKQDYLMKVALANRTDIFTIGPVFAYIVGKLREAQVVRMIMIAKLNNMDAEQVSAVLPELPA